ARVLPSFPTRRSPDLSHALGSGPPRRTRPGTRVMSTAGTPPVSAPSDDQASTSGAGTPVDRSLARTAASRSTAPAAQRAKPSERSEEHTSALQSLTHP